MSEEKINLEKIIKEELYNKHLYFNKTNTVQIKNICLEFGKQLLELAAENAECKLRNKIECSNSQLENGFVIGNNAIVINKQSILDTINQVE